MNKAALMAEAYRRGILPPDKAALYEEAMRRGLVSPAKPEQAMNASPPQPYMGSGPGPDIGDVKDVASTVYNHIPGVMMSHLLSPGAKSNLAQGATLNTSDELKGLAAAATGGDYSNTVNKERALIERYGQQHPGRALASNVAGSLLAPVAGTVGLAAKLGGGAASKIAASTVANAAQGALASAGAAKEGERGSAALKGGTTGAVLGAAVPAVGRTVSTAVSALKSAFERGSTKQAKALAGALIQDNMTPDEVLANIKAAGGAARGATIATQAGANVRAGAVTLAKQPGRGKQIANVSTKESVTRSRKGIVDSLFENLHDEVNFDEALSAKQKMAQELADPLYKKAYAKPVQQGGVLNDIQATPSGAAAIQQAKGDMADEAMATGTPFALDNLQSWDYVKRAYDDMISKAVRAGERNRVRILTGQKSKLIEHLDKNNEDYAAARAIWGGKQADIDAMQAGRELLARKTDTEVVSRDVADMSASEKESFRAGVMRNVLDQIKEVPEEAGSIYKKLTQKEVNRDKLKLAFGNTEKFEQFAEAVKQGGNQSGMRAQVTGGSPTFEFGAQAAAPLVSPAKVAQDALLIGARGAAYNAVNNVVAGRSGGPALSEAVRNRMAEGVYSLDPTVQQQTLEAASRVMPSSHNKVLSAMMRRPVPSGRVLPSITGLLSNQAGGLIGGF